MEKRMWAVEDNNNIRHEVSIECTSAGECYFAVDGAAATHSEVAIAYGDKVENFEKMLSEYGINKEHLLAKDENRMAMAFLFAVMPIQTARKSVDMENVA